MPIGFFECILPVLQQKREKGSRTYQETGSCDATVRFGRLVSYGLRAHHAGGISSGSSSSEDVHTGFMPECSRRPTPTRLFLISGLCSSTLSAIGNNPSSQRPTTSLPNDGKSRRTKDGVEPISPVSPGCFNFGKSSNGLDQCAGHFPRPSLMKSFILVRTQRS
ncbi:hypothetical protein HRR83_007557 [Exophiala dermatitidis]|uniref:Uncharacterized protein n=1 Tax=Exophiala dermatitidis TaxID=5970 RepID=A0AAN6EPW4_EXODE|nr:hypothetical protein HRR74_007003 [Exophiala dermatitidis]KAJ4510536.1 hypothetical protein HRR73_006608 [Exophiala dermatitidis]KAJ4531566.1 hypothetical protein HRR77_009416 [Exophiala dermatitidis]KAJ4535148.1 hypothetical protein HRR76_007040 [Exophiala dermatitidis]KAJ4553323.1 hypothetical protein HRR79_009616 [Exophiala dermatitidis]